MIKRFISNHIISLVVVLAIVNATLIAYAVNGAESGKRDYILDHECTPTGKSKKESIALFNSGQNTTLPQRVIYKEYFCKSGYVWFLL